MNLRHLLRYIVTLIVVATTIIMTSAQCDYQLVWEEDFSGSSLNLDNWQYQTGDGGWGNNELQTYTETNAIVSGGTLQITADEPTPGNYESSRIRSLDLFSTSSMEG